MPSIAMLFARRLRDMGDFSYPVLFRMWDLWAFVEIFKPVGTQSTNFMPPLCLTLFNDATA